MRFVVEQLRLKCLLFRVCFVCLFDDDEDEDVDDEIDEKTDRSS